MYIIYDSSTTVRVFACAPGQVQYLRETQSTTNLDVRCVSDSVTMAAAMQDRERGTYMSSVYYYIMYVRLSLYYYYIIINMYMHVSRQQKTTSIIS